MKLTIRNEPRSAKLKARDANHQRRHGANGQKLKQRRFLIAVVVLSHGEDVVVVLVEGMLWYGMVWYHIKVGLT